MPTLAPAAPSLPQDPAADRLEGIMRDAKIASERMMRETRARMKANAERNAARLLASLGIASSVPPAAPVAA